MPDRRPPRLVLAAALATAGTALAVLGATWSPLAWPFAACALVGAVGAWRGLTGRQLLDALGSDDDPGRGPAGMLP